MALIFIPGLHTAFTLPGYTTIGTLEEFHFSSVVTIEFAAGHAAPGRKMKNKGFWRFLRTFFLKKVLKPPEAKRRNPGAL
ncbi:hypothetical protein D1841_05955 [Neglecta sp. X4]|nr:hypothetical protein [Neglectibacter sp. 59]NBJ72866.1 hypothetical protein [Neglectibacter sp. X4]NCE80750.1 hypothetical protein [Neglectibacter sp. X58]